MEPLDMDCFPDRRELEVKGCAFARRGAHINLSGMFLDNSIAHRKAEARATAIGLGGEKRIEDAVDVLSSNASACIRDLDLDGSVSRRGADFDPSPPPHPIPP